MSFAGQARQEVRQAYKPAFKVLNRQERRVRNMARKQSRDDRAYQNWLRDTNASLNAEAASRDSQLQSVQAQYDQQLHEAIGGTQQQAAQRAINMGGATPGSAGPTNPAGLDPLAQNVAAMGIAQGAAYGGRLATSQRLGLGLSQSVEKNTYATVALVRAQHRQATFDALGKIAAQRGDLAMKRAADVGKRTAELEAAAAKEAQQRFANELALQRLDQGQQRIAQGDQRLANEQAASQERLRQGRVRNQLSRRRLKQAGQQGAAAPLSPSERRQRAINAANANSKIQSAINLANSIHTGGTYKSGKWKSAPKPHHGPGYATKLANWIMTNTKIGNQTLANVAAYKATNPGKPLPGWLARDLKRLTGQV